MRAFLTKKCGIFGIEGGTKLWDFQHRGGDFRPLTSGHTVVFPTKTVASFEMKNKQNLLSEECIII